MSYKIAKLDHEIQIDHLEEAIAKFLKGEIDYITANAPPKNERVNFFFIMRDQDDATKFSVEVNNNVIDDHHNAGTITFEAIRHEALNLIGDFETKYGIRNHENMERAIIFVGGKVV